MKYIFNLTLEEIVVKATVAAWQILARQDGFDVYPDGIFGPASTKVASINQCRTSYTKGLTSMIQATLGIYVDGVYGQNTEAAVKAFQKREKIGVDGKVGLKTWHKLLGL